MVAGTADERSISWTPGAICILRVPYEWSQRTGHSPGAALCVLADSEHGRPILRPHGHMAQQRCYAQMAIGVGVTTKVRQYVSDLVRYGLEAVEGNVFTERKTGHRYSLHIHHYGLVKPSELALFRILDDMVGSYQPERNAGFFG